MEPVTITSSMILGKVASSLFDYGLNTGWDLMFKNEVVTYKKKLEDILIQTVRQFEKTYPVQNNNKGFPFYNSQILLDALLKIRLFKKEELKEITNNVQEELKTNEFIQQPSKEELGLFYQIFLEKLTNDNEFKKIDVDTHYKEVIFETHDAVLDLKNDLKSINHDEIGLLKKEYETQVDEIFEEIKNLQFSKALKRLENLEQKIKSNLKISSKKLNSRIEFVKAICYDHTDKHKEAKESYIKSYLFNPDDIKNLEIVCWIYFKQKNQEYKELAKKVESVDIFNPYLWAIKTIESENIVGFINKTFTFITENFRYKRNIFNFYQSKDASKIKEIEFLFSDIQYEIPKEISYDNFGDLIFLTNLSFSRFINNIRIDFIRPIEITKESISLYNLLDKLNVVKSQSELGKSYNQLSLVYIWLKSELYFDEVTPVHLIDVTKSIENLGSLYACLIANSLQKRQKIDDALELLEKYEEDELLLTLKLYCQTDAETSKLVAEKYLDAIDEIDEYNVVNVSAYLELIIKKKIFDEEQIITILNLKTYSNIHFKTLLILLAETYLGNRLIEIEEILCIKNELQNYEYVNIFIAVLFYDNKYYRECIEFSLPQIHEKPHPGILKISIFSINIIKTEYQDKLIRLLKLWRENFELNAHFLATEIEIHTLLNNWDEVRKINEFALKSLGKVEFFFTSYIDSIAHNKDLLKLKEIADEIINYPFEHTQNAIYISDLLIKNNLIDEGVSLLYNYAKDKTNISARWQFFTLSIELQKSQILKEFEIVEPDCFVRHQVNGITQTTYIPKNILAEEELTHSLLHKAKGESFTIIKKFTGKLVDIKIERIVNKYFDLLFEIQEDFNNPISDYPIEVISFDSDDIKAFENALIENFGLKNEHEKIERIKHLNNYHNNTITFSEVTATNFGNDYISAYYSLTSKESKGFLINPQKPNIKELNSEQAIFVLDFTSGLLLLGLGKSLNLIYSQRFSVGQSVINHIENLIYKTQIDNSDISINIGANTVIPFFKAENFNTNRITFLTEIKDWFITNCEIIIPEEKINFSRELHNTGKYEKGIDLILETSLLGNRENHVLISDDMMYTKFLKMSNKQIPTDHFLTTFYSNNRKDIFNYLILNKYIGINFFTEDLYECYIEKNHQEKSHIYEFCLRNLELYYPFNPRACNSLILEFLKQISINPVYSEDIFEYEVRNIFTRCFNQTISRELCDDIIKESKQLFTLLPTYFDALKRGVNDSINIVLKIQ